MITPDRIGERGVYNPRKDLTVLFLAVDGNEITVEGYVVELDIRTGPTRSVKHTRSVSRNPSHRSRRRISHITIRCRRVPTTV
ncbi:hypothetical protein SAMD00023353_1400710 [Rosellinia necatrix]|uniref:Uncharacterized protein n=1 Tax=Rosellinia necatrix TaxID=77044 RepID=A0A1S8A7X2_ROSNE|nr:hypothetical protein SAMD00023353_1400710 [Rosellinia necatrix]